MKNYMTYSEIKAAFDSEWVLLMDPKTKKNLEIIGGTVLCHSKDRDEVYQRALKLRPKHAAIVYTGKIPEGTAVIL